jgi:hypothetical protein
MVEAIPAAHSFQLSGSGVELWKQQPYLLEEHFVDVTH